MKTLAPFIPLVLLAACSGGASENAAAPEPTAQVTTAVAQMGASSGDMLLYGATEAGPGAGRSVVAPAESIVDFVNAPTGTAVTKGQAVITLRPSRTSSNDIVKANSDLTVATAAYQRALRLRKDGLVADADVETARAAVDTARAARTNLGLSGSGTVLRAPATGTVQGLTAKPGEQIAAGATIASIAAPGDLRARFGIDPAIAQRVHNGQHITIDTIGGGAPADVTVVGVDSQVDATTRLASVFVKVPPSLHMGAGEPLRATLSVGATTNGITIPYSALLDDGGRPYVFVVHGDTAKRQDVAPGNSTGDRIQILKGLKPGDKIVVSGGTALEDGMKVSEEGAKVAK